MGDLLTDRRVCGLFMGSGAGAAEPGMAEHVIELAGVPAVDLELLYLGTATYDAAEPRERQTARFAEPTRGAVRWLESAWSAARADENPASTRPIR